MQWSGALAFADDIVPRLKVGRHVVLSLPQPMHALVQSVLAAAEGFFHASNEEKMSSRLPQECGYRPGGIEYSQSPDRPDQVESFSVTPRSFEQAQQLSSGLAVELHSRMVPAFDLLESVAELVGIEASRALTGRVHNELRGGFHYWSRLQVNYSRPSTVMAPFINELHEDGAFLTLACANAPGLELKMPDATVAPITVAPPEILIMPGEIAWLLSGGNIPPLFHQVRPLAHVRERLSLLFFCDLDPMKCSKPWVCNKVNAHVDIAARVRSSVTRFGLGGFSSENP